MYCAGASLSAALTGMAAAIFWDTALLRASRVFSVSCKKTHTQKKHQLKIRHGFKGFHCTREKYNTMEKKHVSFQLSYILPLVRPLHRASVVLVSPHSGLLLGGGLCIYWKPPTTDKWQLLKSHCLSWTVKHFWIVIPCPCPVLVLRWHHTWSSPRRPPELRGRSRSFSSGPSPEETGPRGSLGKHLHLQSPTETGINKGKSDNITVFTVCKTRLVL